MSLSCGDNRDTMINRREFVQIGLTGAAVFCFQRTAFAGANFYKVIFDERFPASVAFARDMRRQGVAIHGINGDVTALWYHDLYFQWKNSAKPIAGLTTADSLFCLELLARDAGLRVTHRQALAVGLVSWRISSMNG